MCSVAIFRESTFAAGEIQVDTAVNLPSAVPLFSTISR